MLSAAEAQSQQAIHEIEAQLAALSTTKHDMRKVGAEMQALEEELGAPPADLFAHFEAAPMASASLERSTTVSSRMHRLFAAPAKPPHQRPWLSAVLAPLPSRPPLAPRWRNC